MKKLLLLLLLPFLGFSQTQFSFGFDGTTAAMLTAGWARTNQSVSPSTTALWTNATYTEVTVSATTPANAFSDVVYATGDVCPIPNGQAGGGNSFALVNYSSTTSTSTTAGTISNWLISPVITVQNGDIVTFYSRKGTSGTVDYPDRLELRMSSSAVTTVPSTGPTDVGSFTTLCTSVNPTLVAGFVYPKVWTQYTYTVAGLSGPTAVKFGFRYFVTSGGVNGANSDIIGIDSFLVDRPLSTEDFFANNFSMYPNPVADVLNVTSKNGNVIETAQVLDINGRVVNQVNTSGSDSIQINVSNLHSGIYFVKVQSELGVGTSKIIKN